MADLKPIASAHDYAAALSRIDRLMGAELGTAEGRELDRLADLVEMYEDENEPMGHPDPETAIEFRREQTDFRSAGDDLQAG